MHTAKINASRGGGGGNLALSSERGLPSWRRRCSNCGCVGTPRIGESLCGGWIFHRGRQSHPSHTRYEPCSRFTLPHTADNCCFCAHRWYSLLLHLLLLLLLQLLLLILLLSLFFFSCWLSFTNNTLPDAVKESDRFFPTKMVTQRSC